MTILNHYYNADVSRLSSRVLKWKTLYEDVVWDITVFYGFGGALHMQLVCHHLKLNLIIDLISVFSWNLLYNLDENNIFTSRDVKFIVDTFRFTNNIEEMEIQILYHFWGLRNKNHNLWMMVWSILQHRWRFFSNTSEFQIMMSRIESSTIPSTLAYPPLIRSDRARHKPSWMQDYVGSVDTTIIPIG